LRKPIRAGLGGRSYPPFRDRVHAWHPHTSENDLDAHIVEDGIERGGNLAVAVADEKPPPYADVRWDAVRR
jgi:hypothetical protein